MIKKYEPVDDEILGNVNITGDINITGNVTIRGNVNITGDINITGNVTIRGNVNITGNVTVIGNVNNDNTVTKEDTVSEEKPSDNDDSIVTSTSKISKIRYKVDKKLALHRLIILNIKHKLPKDCYKLIVDIIINIYNFIEKLPCDYESLSTMTDEEIVSMYNFGKNIAEQRKMLMYTFDHAYDEIKDAVKNTVYYDKGTGVIDMLTSILNEELANRRLRVTSPESIL